MNAILELVQGLNESEFQDLMNIVGPPDSKFQKLLKLLMRLLSKQTSLLLTQLSRLRAQVSMVRALLL